MFFKVSPFRWICIFRVRGKPSPWYIGLFKILERVRLVAYRVALSPRLNQYPQRLPYLDFEEIYI